MKRIVFLIAFILYSGIANATVLLSGYAQSQCGAGTKTSCACPVPGNKSTGDFLVGAFFSDSNGGIPSLPSGWTGVSTFNSGNTRVRFATKTSDSTETTATTNTGLTGNLTCGIANFHDTDAGTLSLDQSVINFTSSNLAPTITSTVAQTIAISLINGGNSGEIVSNSFTAWQGSATTTQVPAGWQGLTNSSTTSSIAYSTCGSSCAAVTANIKSTNNGSPAFAQGVTHTQGGNTTTSLSLSPPDKAILNASLLVACLTNGAVKTITVPSGWTSLFSNTAGTPTIKCYWHSYVTGDTPPWSWSWTGGVISGLAMLSYTGINSSTPLDVNANANGNSGTYNAPSITVTTKYNPIVQMWFSDIDPGGSFITGPNAAQGQAWGSVQTVTEAIGLWMATSNGYVQAANTISQTSDNWVGSSFAMPGQAATATPTPTPTATATPTATVTATPTASPSCTPPPNQIFSFLGAAKCYAGNYPCGHTPTAVPTPGH